jgi:hypothetical protein
VSDPPPPDEDGLEVCGSCRFWKRPEAGGPGQCRHRSPRAVEDRKSGAWRSQWPPTWGQDWCGSWQEDDLEYVEVARATLYEGPEEPTDG